MERKLLGHDSEVKILYTRNGFLDLGTTMIEEVNVEASTDYTENNRDLRAASQEGRGDSLNR